MKVALLVLVTGLSFACSEEGSRPRYMGRGDASLPQPDAGFDAFRWIDRTIDAGSDALPRDEGHDAGHDAALDAALDAAGSAWEGFDAGPAPFVWTQYCPRTVDTSARPVRARFRGILRDLGTGGAVAGGRISAHDLLGGEIASSTADADGAFALEIEVSTPTFRGAMRVVKEGYWTSNVFSLDHGEDLGPSGVDLVLTVPSAALVELQASLAGEELDPTKGQVALQVYDCARRGLIRDARVELDRPHGRRVYANSHGLPDVALGATSVTGGVLFSNVEPGDAVATAFTVSSGRYTQIGTAHLRVVAGELSSAALLPEDFR